MAAFMTDYDPRGELAPRDVVSRAIVTQMEKTRHPNVYLDLTHMDAATVRSRFPGIAAAWQSLDSILRPIGFRCGREHTI